MNDTSQGQDDPSAPPARKSRGWIKLVILVVVVIGLIVTANVPSVKEYLHRYLRAFVTWAEGFGPWGPVILGAAWIPVCVLMIPGSILTLGTGFVFGIGKGFIAASLGSTIGACVAFLIGRTFARGWISRKIEGNKKFAAVDRAIGREGWKIVLLTRLSPVFPFNLLNYGLGVTRVPFWHYALASWVGMMPGSFMYVYFGRAAFLAGESLTGEADTGKAGQVFLYVGLAVTIAVTVFVTRVAKKALNKAVQEAAEPSEDSTTPEAS